MVMNRATAPQLMAVPDPDKGPENTLHVGLVLSTPVAPVALEVPAITFIALVASLAGPLSSSRGQRVTLVI